ncbi:MAG: hypothetical protein IPM79_05075 [Polyangiaceae bacterium]|jgi:hypothetical protein|nr:hypothetical protein [Polyangiaceae bacterium]MBK8937018.1 hypothetical protein [Polyangiaceae bacterium]
MNLVRASLVVVFASGYLLACGDDAGTGATGTGGETVSNGGGGSAPGGGGQGGVAQGGAGGEGGGGVGGQPMGGAPPNSGDCEDDDDCAGDSSCEEVAPGGFRVCTDIVVPAEMCTKSAFDACCSTADCAEGTCLTTPVTPFCGGVEMEPHNVCAVDECDNEGDCQGGDSICLSAPMLGHKIRSCFYAACHTDLDCTAESGGICAPVSEPCCGGVAGLFCVYPSDGCRSNADCADGHCAPGPDGARCEGGAPICPA